VDGDAKFVYDVRFRGPAAEFEGILRPLQAATHLVGSIVIAANHRNANTGLVEIGEAGNEFETALVIALVAVEDVASDQDEIDLFVDRELDHLSEGALGRTREILRPAACAFA